MGGAGGGHYTAFCKNDTDGKWYEFNDSKTSRVAHPKVSWGEGKERRETERRKIEIVVWEGEDLSVRNSKIYSQ